MQAKIICFKRATISFQTLKGQCSNILDEDIAYLSKNIFFSKFEKGLDYLHLNIT